MRADIEEFGRAAEALIAPFIAKMNGAPPPGLIYHYTNSLGLRGIMQSGSVWLGDAFALNDPSEVAHGVSHAVATVNRFAATGSRGAKLFADVFAQFQAQGLKNAAHINVCSFSEDPDDLGQWRAYGDNGIGFSLGFDASALERAFGWPGGVHSTGRQSFPVHYDESQLQALQEAIIGKMLPLIDVPNARSMNLNEALDYFRQLSVLTTMHVMHVALYFKHNAYRNEREYRFMEMHSALAPLPGERTRVRGYELIKYTEFNWKLESAAALRRIVIGPAAHPRKARAFAEECVSSFSPSTALEIVPSSIPYRAA